MIHQPDTGSASTLAALAVHRWEGRVVVWLLWFWPTTGLEAPGLGRNIVEGSGGNTGEGDQEFDSLCRGPAAPTLRAACEEGGTLPDRFTLDSLLVHGTAGERQVVARWSKEGWVRRTGRGMYEKT